MRHKLMDRLWEQSFRVSAVSNEEEHLTKMAHKYCNLHDLTMICKK